jgi:hypothetical protein
MRGIKGQFQSMREFWEWGKETRIVVRSKLAHEFVTDIRVLDLWVVFHTGQAFRNAKLLFDNDDFKVYAQGKQDEESEWETIRKASEGE